MIEWIKTIFKDRPDTSTPITASWLNKLQDYMMQLGLINDYVVDYGSNENGSWEKWNSGKLIQRGRGSIAFTTAPATVQKIQVFPVPFSSISVDIQLTILANGIESVSIGGTYDSQNSMKVNIFRGISAHETPYSYYVVGRWK